MILNPDSSLTYIDKVKHSRTDQFILKMHNYDSEELRNLHMEIKDKLGNNAELKNLVLEVYQKVDNNSRTNTFKFPLIEDAGNLIIRITNELYFLKKNK
jgi:hypothetical protein